MAITILPPAPAEPTYTKDYDSDLDYEDGGVDLEGDIDMDADARSPKRTKFSDLSSMDVITPGEVVTDDPQWMRLVFLHC